MPFEQADRIVLSEVLANTESVAKILQTITAVEQLQATLANQQTILEATQETIFQNLSTSTTTQVGLLQQILNLLNGVFRQPSKPVALALGFPRFTDKLTGEPMANTLGMIDTEVAHVAIMTLDQFGNPIPAPAGDVDSATSADPTQFTAGISLDANGNPQADVTPQVQTNSAGVLISVTDSAGLTPFTFTVTVSRGPSRPASLFGNLANVTFTTQPEPTAPGPG